MVTIERRNCTRRYLRRMKTISAINLLAIVIVAAFRVSTVKGVKNPRHQVSTTKKSRLENKPESLSKQFYNLGISVHNDDKKPRPFQKLTLRCHQAFHKLWENRMRLFHLFIFVRYSHCTVESILEDSWEAERNPDKYFGKKGILSSKERSVVKRRVVSSSTIRKIVGAGYTPRLVFLFGVMLRGIIHCTAIPKIFEPTIGWGAGSVFAASFAHREWIPAIMIGWYGSQYYWHTIFGVNGPPNPADVAFDGFPITIHRVRVA